MSVLKCKRTDSKAEYVNIANQIYMETIAFLTRLSSRYARLLAEPVAKLAGEVMDNCEEAKFFHPTNSGKACGKAICWRRRPVFRPWTCA